MAPAQMVAHDLPYLRRYARALTGSQNSGDAYVAATLEAMIKEPNILDGDLSPKVALFRLFAVIWNSLAVNESVEAMEASTPAERRLGHLTPRARQAFLLVSLEEFSDEDAPTARADGRRLTARYGR